MNVSNSFLPRYELKFIAEPMKYFTILNWVRQHSSCFKTEYPDRQVNNIYFATYNYNSYSENIYGSSSKSKVRFRWYGSSNEPKNGFLEIKCKRNQLNWKLIYNSYNDSKELYDLKNDPEENNNLIEEKLEIESILWKQLLKIKNS